MRVRGTVYNVYVCMCTFVSVCVPAFLSFSLLLERMRKGEIERGRDRSLFAMI